MHLDFLFKVYQSDLRVIRLFTGSDQHNCILVRTGI